MQGAKNTSLYLNYHNILQNIALYFLTEFNAYHIFKRDFYDYKFIQK